MFPIVSLLVVLSLSLLITRVATVALTHTGLSEEAARFQARSAFTGVGFTTGESETVVNHPVRRRILQALMLVGNVGIITSISTLVLTLVDRGKDWPMWLRLAVLGAGLALLWLVAINRRFNRQLSRLIRWGLRRTTRLQIHDLSHMLRLGGGYGVLELMIEERGWLAGRTLADCQLSEEGLLVLAVTRQDGTFIGAPRGDTPIRAGDSLTFYGRTQAIEELGQRRRGAAGDRSHRQAVAEHQRVEREQAAYER